MRKKILKILVWQTAVIIICFNADLCYSQWYNVSPPGNDTSYYCIDVVSQNIVYAGKGSHGIIMKSTNGGSNWFEVNTPSAYMVYKINFLNETTGFIATGSGIYKTNNGGANWQTLITGGFADLYFPSESTGYAINGDFPAKLYKTTNGGGNFSLYNMGAYPSYYGQAICYVSSSEIFALTVKPSVDSSIIFKNINWDSGWVPVLKTKPACYDISFADANTGIVCGNFGVFRRTTDAGATWQSYSPAGNLTILSCYLNSSSTGFMVGALGTVYKSTNSGINWFSQVSGTVSALSEVDFLPAQNTGFIAGGDGVILKTTNGGITATEPMSNTYPQGFSLLQNYPNPFNPSTKISFILPQTEYITIGIFDIEGKEVQKVAAGIFNAGLNEITVDAAKLSSGVYFYRLSSDKFTQVKKMVLIK